MNDPEPTEEARRLFSGRVEFLLSAPSLDFLRGRQPLRRTLVLIDSRHGIKPPDEEMMRMLDEAAVGYRLVLTKADKVKASELAETLAQVEAEARKHAAAYPTIHVTSAEKGMGIAELRAAILADAEA